MNLQRDEISKNGKIDSLINMSSMRQSKIGYHSKIIDDLKETNGTWKGHARRINNECRPLKEKMDKELILQISRHEGMPNLGEIKAAIGSRRDTRD